MILLENVVKKYDDMIINVNLKINKGEIFGILGVSGSGKTTILNMIQNIVKSDSGTIFKYSDKISMIFQESNLLNNLTVYENIKLALKIKKINDYNVIENVLKFVNLNEKTNYYPSSLSGGQKQKVSIARAISMKPDILLCDEPTASLDNISKKDIVNLFKKINEEYNTTIIIVTHEVDIAKSLCDKIAVIENGKILEVIENEKKNLFLNNKNYLEYVKEVING